MTGPVDRLARQIEQLDTAAAENSQRAENYQRMTERLRVMEGRATSPDGAVTVVAGPGGTVRSVAFTEAVKAMDTRAMAALVTHTIARAQADIAVAQAEVVRGALGDSELLDRALAADGMVFGDQAPRDPGPPPVVPGARTATPAPRGRPPAAADTPPDDDNYGFSVFGDRHKP